MVPGAAMEEGAASAAAEGTEGAVGEDVLGAGRTFSSDDPHVADIANAIEGEYPGHVVGVNQWLGSHECDILTQNAIIEVKAGGSGLARQVAARANLGYPVIAYSPKLGRFAIRDIYKAGGLPTSDVNLLLELVRP